MTTLRVEEQARLTREDCQLVREGVGQVLGGLMTGPEEAEGGDASSMLVVKVWLWEGSEHIRVAAGAWGGCI